jgi:mono/diheme cytochrome c family protein
MRRVATLVLVVSVCGSCSRAPGQPGPESQVVRPSELMNFEVLYATHCAGCHGPQGKGGPAIALADPVYLAIADEATLDRVTREGVPGTAMPAFATSAGGLLTDAQVSALVRGIRARWAKPEALQGANPPPYAPKSPGDSKRGRQVYGVYCASCHGPEGRGGPRASSIVDGSFLALVSDQGLRTTVIVGRPELGAPDWRANVPGKPMSDQEISDVVAWLVSQRSAFPGQPYPSARAAAGGTQ